MEPKIGDRMKVSPQLTDQDDWIDGEVIDVEHNPFMGLVISIKDKLGRIFFGQSRFFVALQFRCLQQLLTWTSRNSVVHTENLITMRRTQGQVHVFSWDCPLCDNIKIGYPPCAGKRGEVLLYSLYFIDISLLFRDLYVSLRLCLLDTSARQNK